MICERYDHETAPILVLRGSTEEFRVPERCVEALAASEALPENPWRCLYRSVEIGRLEAILSTGIDVAPTDAPIFAATLDKAFEYGDWPKVTLMLRTKQMQRSFTVTSPASSPEEISAASARFPTCLHLADGDRWWTRFPDHDARAGTDYELAYGWFVPGDAVAALAAVLVWTVEPPGSGSSGTGP